MSDLKSPAEKVDTYTPDHDEIELARMGYKQELK
jgi:hypothetical protein